jgi:hypothetical protein
VLFALGAALRVWLLIAADPAFIGYPDSAAYMVAAETQLFSSRFQPAGYSLFLRVAHVISDHLTFTVALQHVLGLVTAGIYLAMVRRVASVRWVALVPAVFLLFDGVQLFIEHAVMSEILLLTLIGVALYAAIRAQDGPPWPWVALMGIALSGAVVVRAVALPLIVIVPLWLWLARRDAEHRLRAAGAGFAIAATLVGLYVVVHHSYSGAWGLTRADAFNPYLRVASFADCERWTPPPGTDELCLRHPPPESRREPGPYLWACPLAPALCEFGDPPDANARFRAFTRAAIWHQPGDYVAAVGRDLVRYVDPPHGLSQGDLLDLVQSPFWARANVPAMASYYSERGVASAASSPPVAYGLAIHTNGVVIAILIAGALLAIPLCRGRERTASLLFASSGVVLLVAAAATASFSPRFPVPALAPLSAATALGLSGAIARVRNTRARAAR